MTIGGNESDSIRKTRVELDASGMVRQHKANPFICVVQDLKVDVASQAAEDAIAAAAAPSERLTMAKIIVDFEARRDSQGRLMVYNLPADFPKESVNPQRQEAESTLRGIAGVEGVGEGRDHVGAPTWIAYVRDESVVSHLPSQVGERIVVPPVTGEITARPA